MIKVKKIVLIIFLLILYKSIIPVYAGEKAHFLTEYNVINEDSFSRQDLVTREECITAVMKIIGVTDEDIKLLNGADLYTFADNDTYSYVGCAYMAGIAYGEECVIDYQTYRTLHTRKNIDIFFFPDREVTLKEAVAFMVRCLENTKEKNLDLTFEKAKEYNLIKNSDEFIEDSNMKINQKILFTLLERMLQQKRYIYYVRENDDFEMECSIDKEKSITYLDFLKQR